MSRDIDEAFDTRIEPWNPRLPGCTGECQQGHRPCLHPEECWPDEPFAIRHPYLTGFGLFLLIVLLVEFLALLVWWWL